MTNHTLRLGALAAALLTLAAGASAQVTKTGAGYQFRMKFTPGKTVKYTIRTSVPLPNQPKPAAMVMPIQQKTTAVTGGVANLAVKLGPMQLNGKAMGEARTAEVKVDKFGKTVGTSGGQGSFTTFPAGPIKIGGTWTSTAPLGAMGTGGGNATATYKLLSVAGNVAKISVSLKSTNQSMAMSGSGTGTISVADGQLNTLSMAIKANNPQGGPMNVTVNVTRG